MSATEGRTSDFYRTKNLPEKFDNPDTMIDEKREKEKEERQKCYMSGNPVFSCINPPPLLPTTDLFNSLENTTTTNEEKKINPLYRTSNSDYGMNKPTVHTMPTTYLAKSAAFTGHLGKTGMYRNQSLNTAITRSKVYD